MEDREIRLRAANQRSKAYIIARVNEILDDYLMDDDEDLAIIDFKFKKGDEHQEKHLIWRRKES
jgi:hypothetical protein